ncbi:unnamed protein product [Aureobasidium mustum]|uniref:Uncharacterized protein n=1 Tax=Aureobasidium mustum TaxID=2773714 RepID=A0A9N8JX31_9PEZI|nr:unnamed protein product [Aureobasidium mustum]
METPQRSLRQEIETLRTEYDRFESAVLSSFNKLKQNVQILEQRTRSLGQQTLALQEQNRVLEERINAVEEENRTLRAVVPDVPVPRQLDLVDQTSIPESISEDLSVAQSPEDTISEHETERDSPERPYKDNSPEYMPSPSHHESGTPEHLVEAPSRENSPEYMPSPSHYASSPAPIGNNAQNASFTVWYDDGTLNSDAPQDLLSTQDWRLLLAAFGNTRLFFQPEEDSALGHYHSHHHVCPQCVAKELHTVDSQQRRQVLLQRCFNTQRVCLKYNEESGRLEALPVPEEARPEGAPFGLKWFVAEQTNMSNKAGFKGLWEAT